MMNIKLLTHFNLSLFACTTTSTRLAWLSQLVCFDFCRFLPFCLTPRTPCLLVELGVGDTQSDEKVKRITPGVLAGLHTIAA
jgi:hypothetical protein